MSVIHESNILLFLTLHLAVGGFGKVRLGVRVRGLGLGSVGRETQTSGLSPGGLAVGQVSPSSSSLPCPLLCHSLPPSHIAFPLFLSESLPSPCPTAPPALSGPTYFSGNVSPSHLDLVVTSQNHFLHPYQILLIQLCPEV